MKRRWAVCPCQGRSDSWRTIWRIPGAEDHLYVVRGEDQRGCEDPLDPAEADPVIDRWAGDRDARAQLLKLYDALRAPHLPPGLPDAVIERTVKPRLREAFRRGELLLIRIRPLGIGAGAINALLAPAPEKPPPEKQKKEQVERLLLQILRVDDHFVPKTEKLDIVYELEGFSGKSVRLDIESKHHGLVFSRDLEAPEKTDGSHTFYWDGKCTSPADRYAHPLLSPFRVHLYHDATWTDERNFKILYHSIVLKNGPWTPDEKEPPESDEKPWAAYKLNQLGYYGGPVGTDLDDYLKRAIIRYKANHKKLREQYYPNYDDTIGPALKAALKAKENDRKFPVPDATENPGAKSVLNVEALTYERTGPGADEFGNKRSPYEKDRLNRPLVPVEVEIWLKKKDNSKVFQPEAVGPCRIDWRFADSDEDLSPQYTKTASEPSMTKTFIEKSLKLKSGRTGSNGDDCPKDFAGIREDPATNWRTPFQTGDSYVPYSVQEDGGNKVVYTIACEDKAKYPKRQGKAGVFFRPSYIAADDYKLSAEIDFTGQPNKEELEKLHGITSPGKKIKAETGTYTVRRFNKVAMSIEWPARKNSYEWGKIAGEFGKAFNDVDTKGIVTKKIGQVLTEKQYKDIVTANTAHTDPSKIGYYADYLVGEKLPKQGNRDADDYKAGLENFCDYNQTFQERLGEQISDNVRKEHATGFIVVSFLLHRPVNIMNDPAHGDRKVTKANTGFVTWAGSIGLADSVILADQKDPDKVYYVVSHEMGHGFYLVHWENVKGDYNPSDHDQDDHNCTMSYSDSHYADPGHYAFQEPGKYTPHFCGKCNLALRGWDIVAGGMVAKAIKGKKKKAEKVTPLIELKKDIVAVKKKHTTAARLPITLKTDTAFTGKGMLTRSSDAIHFFTKASKGKEITFNGKDNVFSGSKLTSGMVLYAQGATAGEVTITLKLTGGAKIIGPDATGKLTSVEATLQIGKKRPSPVVDPALLTEAEKVDPGRAIHVQDAGNTHLRAMLVIEQAKPASFAGTLVLRANNSKVKVFQNETGGAELPLPHQVAANTIPVAGLKLWVEGAKVSRGFKDTGLKLGIKGIERDADHVIITVVRVRLSVGKSRKKAGAEPEAMSDADKLNPGRFVHKQDPGNHHGRALLIVHRVKPKDFTGKLVLGPLEAVNPRVELFRNETGGAALASPLEIDHTAKFPAKGKRRWAQGKTVSAALRDTGFKLGIKDAEDQCDQAVMTVLRLKKLKADIPCTPAHAARGGVAAPLRHTLERAAGALAAADFDEDFTANRPLVLMENSIQAADPINLSVEVEPANVPVSWSTRRDTRAAPGGDHSKVRKLSPNRVPTITPDGGDPLKATLVADAVGSFHVCPFVDCNGSGDFDQNDDAGERIDREPFLILNLVLVRATLFHDDSAARATLNAAAIPSGPGFRIRVSSGAFNIANPAGEAVHMNVRVDLVSGGRDGRRELANVFAGWVNNESLNEDIRGTFQDPGAPAVNHSSFTVFASNRSLVVNNTFLPGGLAPVLEAPPLLDTGRPGAGTGGESATLTRSRVRTKTNRLIGQRWLVETIDSPGDGDSRQHPGFPAAVLVQFRFHLDFSAFLCFWTNLTGAAGATGDPADRLYAVLGQIGWRMRGEWMLNQTTGALAEVTAPTVTLTGQNFGPLQPAADTAVEVRPPTGLSLLARDARA